MGESLWQRAASHAARAHEHQARKDGKTPYVAHVFRVAMTARHVFGCEDEVVLAAALLHDTIEDTPTDFDEIEELFGVEVARCVAALTKNMLLPEAEREPEYDARLAAAGWRARLIKLADVYDNFSDSADRSPGFLAKLRRKCERAIALAEHDTQEASRRGVAAVRGLLSSAG